MNAAVLVPIIIAIVAIIPGTLAYFSGRRQEGSKATREDFDSLRTAYREDNQELRNRVDEAERQQRERDHTHEAERTEWRDAIRRVQDSEAECTRRLSWLLGKLNIPLSDLDKGMNGESIKF